MRSLTFPQIGPAMNWQSANVENSTPTTTFEAPKCSHEIRQDRDQDAEAEDVDERDAEDRKQRGKQSAALSARAQGVEDAIAQGFGQTGDPELDARGCTDEVPLLRLGIGQRVFDRLRDGIGVVTAGLSLRHVSAHAVDRT